MWIVSYTHQNDLSFLQSQLQYMLYPMNINHFWFISLQHFIGQREEFETARDSILVWLTEMDLQLTNIEHFSECDVQAKIKQLKVSSKSLRNGAIAV